MGRAADLFQRLKTERVAGVTALIAEAQSENLWLDFKRAGNDGKGSKLHESDWKNLAKALSGFANSDGGVIVWGVDCKSDPVLGDLPSGTAPLENPTRFVSWIENAISGCTIPAVPGVENLAIVESGGNGFVATLVPASPLSPHQCVKPTGVLQYYMRAGSNFMAAPHGLLAGMFGRRPQPRVFPTYYGTAVLDQNGPNMRIKIDAFVHAYNEGPAIARDAFMNVLLGVPGGGSQGSFEIDPGGSGNWSGSVEFGCLASAIATPSHRIAPRAFARVFRLRLEFIEPFTSQYGMKITAGCDGAPIAVVEMNLTADEMQEKYQTALGILLEKKPKASDRVVGMFLPGSAPPN